MEFTSLSLTCSHVHFVHRTRGYSIRRPPRRRIVAVYFLIVPMGPPSRPVRQARILWVRPTYPIQRRVSFERSN